MQSTPNQVNEGTSETLKSVNQTGLLTQKSPGNNSSLESVGNAGMMTTQAEPMDVHAHEEITASGSMQGESRSLQDIWTKIQISDGEEQKLLDSIQNHLMSMNEVVRPARNIHKTVKDDMKKVMSFWKRLTSLREAVSKTKSSFGLMVGCSPQTPQILGEKRTHKTPMKRKERSPPQNETAKKRREEQKTPKDGQRVGSTFQPPPPNPGTPPPAGTLPPWQKAETKKTRKKKNKEVGKGVTSALNQKDTRNKKAPRERPARPDALIIKAADGKSYADILRKMQAEPKLDDLGSSVSKVRKTTTGELLLELHSKAEGKATEFQKIVEEVLDQGTKIRTLQDEVVFEIKDLDEITTKENIVAALQRELQSSDAVSVEEKAVKSLRKAYGDTQTAIIRLPAKMAHQMIAKQKIKIGWVVCRIREMQRETRPIRCFKCLGFGHIAKNCTVVQDRSRCCYKCGSEGHKARACDKETKCVLCHERDAQGKNDHAAGSYACPVYRAALEALKRRRK